MCCITTCQVLWDFGKDIIWLAGGLEQLYYGWSHDLHTIFSLLEAYIDFSDENIPQEILNQVITISGELKCAIIRHLNDNRRGGGAT